MRFPIRNLIMAPAFVAAAALAVTTASAATQLNVPFNFTVAGKACPAGIYTVQRGISPDSVYLASKDASRSFVWITSPGSPLPTDQRIILTFDTNGDAHQLQSVQYGNKITSRLDKPAKNKEYQPTRIMAGQ